MVSRSDIKPQMQVLTSDRAFLGTVDGVDGDDIRVTMTRAGEGQKTIPLAWVERVDEHVHLNRAGGEIEVGLQAANFGKDKEPKKAEAAPAERNTGGSKIWVWVVIAVVVILLLMMLF